MDYWAGLKTCTAKIFTGMAISVVLSYPKQSVFSSTKALWYVLNYIILCYMHVLLMFLTRRRILWE